MSDKSSIDWSEADLIGWSQAELADLSSSAEFTDWSEADLLGIESLALGFNLVDLTVIETSGMIDLNPPS